MTEKQLDNLRKDKDFPSVPMQVTIAAFGISHIPDLTVVNSC